MSDDGNHAIVLIAMLGNPFSPGYARARALGPARATDHCALNVAVYSRAVARWSLRERAVEDSARAADGVVIGSSTMRWDGGALVVEIDERSTPFARPIRGRVVLRPESTPLAPLPLEPSSAHLWWPVAARARIEVQLHAPSLRFTGHGYHDANAGSAPLESHFARWSWARARLAHGAVITYDVVGVDGAERSLAFRIDRRDRLDALDRTWSTPLPRSTWGLDRAARVDRSGAATLARSLEDGPFYARDRVAAQIAGEATCMMHETLSVDRLRRRWVQFLAGFRMGRAA